jgi:hypothetical protein
VSNTGFYQVTFGAAIEAGGAVDLQLNGTNFTTGSQFILEGGQTFGGPPAKGMSTLTVIIHITTSPGTVYILNTTTSSGTLSDDGSGLGPSAFITLVKVQ